MSSRDKILATVRSNQPEPRELPLIPFGASAPIPPATDAAAVSNASAPAAPADLAPVFITALEAIGGAAYIVSDYRRIATILHEQFPNVRRIVSGCPQLTSFAEAASAGGDPHALETVELAILPAHFGVAENGACWITETQMVERVLPFIAQHLVLVIDRQAVVANMHEAYERIAMIDGPASTGTPPDTGLPTTTHPGTALASSTATPPAAGPTSYGFSTFIAGPSKTADIEQSLVLGAHGPMSLTVFLLDGQIDDAGFY